MFNEADPNEIENWACIMEAGTEYEIEMAKEHLADQDIPANILSKRDSALSLNVGETALVYLYVPNEYEEEAREILAQTEIDNKGEEE